eukprot:6201413-Pleurochrysis_carterae.AAC.1
MHARLRAQRASVLRTRRARARVEACGWALWLSVPLAASDSLSTKKIQSTPPLPNSQPGAAGSAAPEGVGARIDATSKKTDGKSGGKS